LIDIDLADRESVRGPPPSHLLAPAWLFAVLFPLASVGLLQRQTVGMLPVTRALEQQIASDEQAARLRGAQQQREAALRQQAAAASNLQRAFIERIDLMYGLMQQVPLGIRLDEVRVSGGEVAVSGSSASSGAVPAWLTELGRDSGLVWSAPELRQAGAGGRVAFVIRGRTTGAPP